VRDVVTRRLQALSADCQQLLSLAAVVGREFRLPVVAAVVSQACPPLQRPVLDLLEEVLAARLITNIPQSLGHYSFAHELIRETLYAELPVHARVRLHQRVGDALEHLCRPHLEPYLSELVAHFTAAVQRNTLLGAPPKLAMTQRHYATMLLARQWPGDREKAVALLHQALTVGQELAMDEHVQHVLALREQAQLQGTSAHRAANLTPPTLGATNLFRQEGDYWTISYQGTVFRLKHVRGLHYMAHLLQHPHQKWHVFDLVTLARAPASLPSAPMRPFLTASALRGADLGDAGEILDLSARTAYKRRLHELQAELAQAQRVNDTGREATVQQEIDMLLQQLAAAVGMGGRSRHAAAHAERARVNVTNGIRVARAKIAAHSPPLAQYLTTTIKTGLFCSYTPAPHSPIVWQF
jgi:hypothetical protein